MYSKKFLLSLVLVSAIGFMSYAFGGSAELGFNTGHVNVHLNCTPYPTVNVVVSGTQYKGYSAFLPWLSNLNFTNVTINDVPSGTFPNGRGAVAQDSVSCAGIDCMKFAAATDGSSIDGSYIGGTFTVENSGFFRNRIIEFTGGSVSAILSRVDTGAGGLYYSVYNSLLVLSALTVSGDLGPCWTDNDAPAFGFLMTPHVANYTLPQFNDRVYRFDLTDTGGDINDWGFSSGYYDDWSPDFDNGTYYDQTVLNGSGIDLATFVMQIAVETSPDSGVFSGIILTGAINFTGGDEIIGSNANLKFYPYDFIWNRWNRNYTGSLTTGALWPDSASDVDGNWSFGTEREVIMTGYVYDRANNISNTFSRHFNYGAKPWSSNKEGSGMMAGCGPDGSSAIQVNDAPTSDSGAYIQKYNSGFYLRPFKVFLHDDWAGIDTGTISVTITGTQGGILTGITLTAADLGLAAFSRVGPVSILTTNGRQSVTSVPDSMRNYIVTINYAGKRDAETPINVTVNYKDLANRAGDQVACNYSSTVAPYSNTRQNDVYLLRTPFPMGGIISGFVIDLKDEWAGVDSGSIVLTISGYEFTGGVLSPKLFVFTGPADLGSWLNEYTVNYPAFPATEILDNQQYNYTITVPNSTAYFDGYFAPEYPILITISYKDLKLSNVNSNGSNKGIDINENPMLRGFTATAPIDWGVAFPLSTYSATSGNTQFTGLEFSVMDHRAGVSGDYNLVIVTGYRRGDVAKYVFTTPTSTLSEPCTTNCVAGVMTSEAALVGDVDTHQEHPTQVPYSTGYKFQITGHQIYFDYGIYGQSRSYAVNVYYSDLRPDAPNQVVSGTSLDLPDLACQYLSRCSHDQLTFVWGSGVTNMNQTVDMNPLTGTIDGNVVDIFGGSRVSVVGGSGTRVDTGTSILYCFGASGQVDNPITLDFTNANPLGDTPTSTGYSNITLKVADGLFELTGDTLIVK